MVKFKPIIFLFVFSFNLIAWGDRTYYVEIESGPNQNLIQLQLAELVDSRACYGADGNITNEKNECHRFEWFKSNDVLKPYLKNPKALKLSLVPGKNDIAISIAKWNGKKVQTVLKDRISANVERINKLVIGYTHKL